MPRGFIGRSERRKKVQMTSIETRTMYMYKSDYITMVQVLKERIVYVLFKSSGKQWSNFCLTTLW